ncbi:MAG TPA: nucleotidyltransferase domain-containing protein [Solirubrobacteraceae bacterium]|jgi:predicted nucleotidyltransferase|nr:nucleotidyltransferase domain-containing protein [Solirubrobacteraceae bacterium]
MRSRLPIVAETLDVDERTLRRAAERGAIRCHRPGPRKLELADGELDYLLTHWDLMRALTRALRTEPNVRLAILYGSMARGDERSGSDVDLLVDLVDESSRAARGLVRRLERAVDRDVDLARSGRALETSPLLVLQVIDEGRVLVDRDRRWSSLVCQRGRIVGAALRAQETLREQATASFNELVDLAS